MSTSCTTITVGLNASPTEYAAALNVFLASVNPISIVSLDHQYPDRSKQQLKIKLCYQTGGANYLALLFQSDLTETSDDKANAFFTANPTIRTYYILDISNPYLRNLQKDVTLILAVPDFTIDIQDNKYMAIVEPVAPVGPGTAGSFKIIGSTGPLGSFLTATNQDVGMWAPGEYGWAAVDPATGNWQAWSTCCP